MTQRKASRAMTRRELEADIESACVELAAAEGFRSAKLDRLKRSDPDRLFYHPVGVCFLTEFKRPGKAPRPQQAKRIEELRSAGFEVQVIDNVRDFETLLALQRRAVQRMRKYLEHVRTTAAERGYL